MFLVPIEGPMRRVCGVYISIADRCQWIETKNRSAIINGHSRHPVTTSAHGVLAQVPRVEMLVGTM